MHNHMNDNSLKRFHGDNKTVKLRINTTDKWSVIGMVISKTIYKDPIEDTGEALNITIVKCLIRNFIFIDR